jgi:hypothetical protein
MAPQAGQSDTFSINGLYLKFYLDLIKDSTAAFEKKDAELYYLHTYHLRSLITDPTYINAIDAAIKKKREEFKTTLLTPEGTQLDTKTKRFLECFCIVENCMKFLDYTLKITKRDVEVNADQMDEGMPQNYAGVEKIAEAGAGTI